MAAKTATIEELLGRRMVFETELCRLEGEKVMLNRRIDEVSADKAAVDREIAKALELEVLTPGLSVRQALKEILRSGGDAGLTVDEICHRVRRKTNKGTRDTILGYLEREAFAVAVPESGKWRANGR